MKRINYSLFFLFTLIIACNMPKPDKAVAMMNRYWNFYQVENYDSLKTFYISNGENVDTSFWRAIHQLHENYGSVKNVTMTKTGVEQSLGEGESIELAYEVELDKKVITHEFAFKKDEKGVFRISNHEFNQ
jgi:hypothetical protein